MPTEACLIYSEVLANGLGCMVIIGKQSFKSTFGASNQKLQNTDCY